MGSGVALAGVGGVFGFLAQDQANNYKNLRSEYGRSAYRDEAEGHALTADIFYAAGLATALVGATIVLLDDEEAQETDPAYNDQLVQRLRVGPAVIQSQSKAFGVGASGSW